MEGPSIQAVILLLTVTSLIYSQGMHVTHLVCSNHVTLWKSSLDLVAVPQTLLTLKQHPSIALKLENHFLIAEMKEV